MSHLAAQLPRKRTPRRSQPYDHPTKAKLWERLKEAESKAEALRLHLRRIGEWDLAVASGEIRDILRGRKS